MAEISVDADLKRDVQMDSRALAHKSRFPGDQKADSERLALAIVEVVAFPVCRQEGQREKVQPLSKPFCEG